MPDKYYQIILEHVGSFEVFTFYHAKSLVTGWKGIGFLRRADAVQQGEEHQRLLLSLSNIEDIDDAG